MKYKEIPDHEHPKIDTHIVESKTNAEAALQAHKDDKGDPHEVTKTQVGLSNVLNILDKIDATVPPTINEDSGDGYSIGSHWMDVTADKAYICLDATVGAAVWKETTLSGATDNDAIHDNVASEISAITEKTTLADNDLFIIEDSADSNNKKRVKKSNVGGGASSKVWLHVTMAANQTSVVINDIVEFDEKLGNITFNTTTHKATLLSGKTYRLTAQLRMTGYTGYVAYQWWDYTNSVWLKGGRTNVPRATSYSENYSSASSPTLIASVIVTPAANIEVGLKIYNISGLNTIGADNSTWGYIEEK